RRHTRFSRDWSSDVCSSDLAQLLEDLDVADLVFIRMGILETEEDAGLALLLGLADVGGVAHWHDQVAVFAHQFLAGADAVDGGQIGRASCRERSQGWQDGLS